MTDLPLGHPSSVAVSQCFLCGGSIHFSLGQTPNCHWGFCLAARKFTFHTKGFQELVLYLSKLLVHLKNS